MSYNPYRRVFRAQMKSMIEEFKQESSMTSKELDRELNKKSGEPRVKSLKDRFNKMIKLALGHYNKVEETPSDVIEDAEVVESKQEEV